jgi:hypothetical protein
MRDASGFWQIGTGESEPETVKFRVNTRVSARASLLAIPAVRFGPPDSFGAACGAFDGAPRTRGSVCYPSTYTSSVPQQCGQRRIRDDVENGLAPCLSSDQQPAKIEVASFMCLPSKILNSLSARSE